MEEQYRSALKYIHDAKKLNRLLGGTDETVKQYLFNLPQENLNSVLEDYEEIYNGESDYARETLPYWISGRVKMSGMVAERFYKLLPPIMPLRKKFQIAEELWRHVGPSSHKVLRFGETASYPLLVSTIETYITDVVHDYRIPENLENRFDWLAGDDIEVKQQLLNHLQNLDKTLVTEAAISQAKAMLEHLSTENAGYTQLYSHTVSVGKHELQLVADHEVEGCKLEDYVPTSSSHSGRYSVFNQNQAQEIYALRHLKEKAQKPWRDLEDYVPTSSSQSGRYSGFIWKAPLVMIGIIVVIILLLEYQ